MSFFRNVSSSSAVISYVVVLSSLALPGESQGKSKKIGEFHGQSNLFDKGPGHPPSLKKLLQIVPTHSAIFDPRSIPNNSQQSSHHNSQMTTNMANKLHHDPNIYTDLILDLQAQLRCHEIAALARSRGSAQQTNEVETPPKSVQLTTS